MSHYIRKMFSKPQNLRQLHRTVSGLDKNHIKTGNYLYQNFKKNHLPEIAESLQLLNIFGRALWYRVSNVAFTIRVTNTRGAHTWPNS